MMTFKKKIIFPLIGWAEVLIGAMTLAVCIYVQCAGLPGIQPKPQNVFIFVIASSIVTVVLGSGLVMGKTLARAFLVFFSGYIIMTKLLIYAGLLSFNAPVMVLVPVWVKDGVSFLYHAFLIVALSNTD